MSSPETCSSGEESTKDFIEFVWLFAVSVNWTKSEARKLLKTCGNNIFQADLSNDIAWTLVKLIDNVNKWDGGNVGEKRKHGVQKFILCVVLAGMTRVLNCTRLPGSVFKQ